MSKPLLPKHMNLTATWKYPSNRKLHAGYDYDVDIGSPVFAVRGGTILRVVDTIENMEPDEEGVSGDDPNFILQLITYKGRPATVVYLHISPHSLVEEGATVEEGVQIATSGHNGFSTGPHLHISAVLGEATGPFDYRDGLTDASRRPRNGLASNKKTIFPPRLVYGRGEPVLQPRSGPIDVAVSELVFGTRDSESVRNLQRRLNEIPLEGGAELRVTGNYTKPTRDEVIKWQLQKRHHKPGSPFADGDIHPRQARIMFGKRFRLVE